MMPLRALAESACAYSSLAQDWQFMCIGNKILAREFVMMQMSKNSRCSIALCLATLEAIRKTFPASNSSGAEIDSKTQPKIETEQTNLALPCVNHLDAGGLLSEP